MQILDITQKDYDQKRPIYDEIRVDPAFRKVGKSFIGFHVWRIENDFIEYIARDKLGTFCDENAYIIYSASLKGAFSDQSTICREIKTPTAVIERYVHLWLGANVSAEQSKIASHKFIELDVYFNHHTTQFRETQGHESIRFLSYFKDCGLTILSGTTEIRPHSLYQIQGKTCPVCVQKKTINWQHFTSGHVMLLQTPDNIFMWIGRASTAVERIHGMKFADRLKARYNLLDIVVVDDGYEQSMPKKRKDEWNTYLNLSQRFVQPLVITATPPECLLKLYQCNTINGIFRVELVKSGKVEQLDLYSREATYILDGADNGVWIWMGQGTTKQEKAEAIRHARGYVIKKNYPATTPIIRVTDGHEPTEFIGLFPTWIYSDTNRNSLNGVLEKFDALTLIQRPKLAAQIQLIDDGCGELKIYRVEHNDLKEVSKKFGIAFFTEECYIIHYQTLFGGDNNPFRAGSGGNKHVVYLWAGRNSTNERRATGEIFLSEMCDHLKNGVVEIRVNDGLEPPHFLQLFKGKLIIFNGKSSGLDPTKKIPSHFMLKVVGNSTYSSKATQVSSKTVYTPEDCYILKAVEDDIWIWCGQCSTGDTREMAKSIAFTLGESKLVMEANEPDEFFTSVGEKFLKQLKRSQTNLTIQPLTTRTWDKSRVGFYICITEQGHVKFHQILAFDQKDLLLEHVYLLDVGSVVYIWLGDYCLFEERRLCWQMAKDYLNMSPVERETRIPIAVIMRGDEPITFTGFFENWNLKHWDSYQTFDRSRQMVETTDSTIPIPSPRISFGNGGNVHPMDGFDKYQKYPLEMLRGETDPPSSVDPRRKEVHLTHDDFINVFKMSYSDFEGLPKWKQIELKKHYKLF